MKFEMTLREWSIAYGYGNAIARLPEYDGLWDRPHYSVAAVVKSRILLNSHMPEIPKGDE